MKRRDFVGTAVAMGVGGFGVPNLFGKTPEDLDKPTYITRNGCKVWLNEFGERHRTDGPAVIYSGGSQRWFQNGKLHRLDGPAEILAGGSQRWFQNGKLHRLDGPAVIWADGSQFWYVDGVGPKSSTQCGEF